MANNILNPSEIESFVSTLFHYEIEDLGTITWYEQHQRLQKLNLQAIVEVNGLVEENVKDHFITEDRICFLVKEAIGINVWKILIFNRLFSIIPEPENTFMAYIMLLHEGTCVSLLENILFHADACESLGDSCIDLTDYAMSCINDLLIPLMTEANLNDKFDKENTHERVLELDKQRETIQNDINLRCITIISYMTQNLESLPSSLTHRLLVYHDTPVIFSYLIKECPWVKDHNGPIKKVEAHCWLALRQLLINPENTQNHYEITEHRKQTLVKVLVHLTDSVIDQIPPLGDLKILLTHLQLSGPGSNVSNRPLILEIGPEIRDNITKMYVSKLDYFIKMFAERLFNASDEEMKILARGLTETYDLDTLDAVLNNDRKCAGGCGSKAQSRCSRCREVWYCGRNCQVNDWENHKKICEKIYLGREKLTK